MRSGSALQRTGGNPGGAVSGDDEAMCAKEGCGTNERPQVSRIGDVVGRAGRRAVGLSVGYQ